MGSVLLAVLVIRSGLFDTEPVRGFVLGLVLSLVHFFAHISEGDTRDHVHSFLIVLLAAALLTHVFKTRLYALKVQDRVIRLEERLRLAQILAEHLRAFR